MPKRIFDSLEVHQMVEAGVTRGKHVGPQRLALLVAVLPLR